MKTVNLFTANNFQFFGAVSFQKRQSREMVKFPQNTAFVNFRSKCRKKTSKYLIVAALYLDLKHLKLSKSDGETDRQRQRETERETERDRDRETETEKVLLPS